MEVANIVILSAMAFASSNIDGMIIAIAYMSNPTYNGRNVLLGQILGFWILTIASLVIAQTLHIIPKENTYCLGLIPIIFGCVKLYNYTGKESLELVAVRPNGRQIQEISLLTIATGADELIAYSPIFATRKPHEITALFIIFLIMTVIWWMMAKWLVDHQIIRRLISNRGPLLAPALMIIIGLMIITND
jgi:cadmium resistance protein CadD (predicted permease)